MISFLFWNIKKNESILPLIADIGEFYDVDIILIAECTIPLGNLVYGINYGRENKYFHTGFTNCEKIVILARFRDPIFIKPVLESDRVTVRYLQLPGLTDILLVATHHISKNHSSVTGQYSEATKLSNLIKDAEKMIGHSRTLLVGDLNMNPFEDGVVGAEALHSVSSRKIALKNARKVQGIEYPFFYNPMWNLMGDSRTNPPGTYHYSSSDHISLFWNVFDQVLVRPDLVQRFSIETLNVVAKAGEKELLSKRGIPNKSISDHLPIVFSLDL